MKRRFLCLEIDTEYRRCATHFVAHGNKVLAFPGEVFDRLWTEIARFWIVGVVVTITIIHLGTNRLAEVTVIYVAYEQCLSWCSNVVNHDATMAF